MGGEQGEDLSLHQETQPLERVTLFRQICVTQLGLQKRLSVFEKRLPLLWQREKHCGEILPAFPLRQLTLGADPRRLAVQCLLKVASARAT